MNLIKSISLKNFRSFRDLETFDFSQLSYLIGVNNAGKTNLLRAIKAFFDDSFFEDERFLNRTEFLSKKAGYNRSEITLKFDLSVLSTKRRKSDLIRRYGENPSLTKVVTYTPDSEARLISWRVAKHDFSQLPEDLVWLLRTVKISYIHPQEGEELLLNVQKRLKQRLLANWGRGLVLTKEIRDLQEKWLEMRNSANRYLSQALSDSLQSFWPDSGVVINLPKSIKDIIDISDISFRPIKGSPDINLTDQGTGAQSTVLYLASYLLDSDRTLNRGEYHPVWLMEEPESFLHADLLIKLGNQIHSQWLKSIQMVISTHSPLLLASSREAEDRVVWNILSNNKKTDVIRSSRYSEEKITQIGELMGDPNFLAYFTIAQSSKLVFIEDEREDVKKAYADAGIRISEGPSGISKMRKYFDVLSTTPSLLRGSAYFIVDRDKGVTQIKEYLDRATSEEEVDGFQKFRLREGSDIFIILLPKDVASEGLFNEFEEYLNDCLEIIWDDRLKLKAHIPTDYSRVVSLARSRVVENRAEAINLIKNEQDIKNIFWRHVHDRGYKFTRDKVDVLQRLIQ